MIMGLTMDPQVAQSISLRRPHLPLRTIEHSTSDGIHDSIAELNCHGGLPEPLR